MIWVCNDIMTCCASTNQQVITCLKSKIEKVGKDSRNKDTRTMSMSQLRRFGVFIVILEHISHLFLMSTVDFEQLVAG